MALVGKVSYFGGPTDHMAGSTTASGASVKVPGIAVYNQKTLGGYWRVKFPNGRTVVLKQTDIGPAPWTGRKVDVTYSALGKAGYSTGNFPTDSVVSAQYLGKNPSAAQAATSMGGTPGSSQTITTTNTTPGVNRSGDRKALVASMLLQNGPLSLGRLETTVNGLQQMPDTPAVTTQSSRTVNTPGGTVGGSGGSVKSMFPGGVKLNRIDQGQDLQTKPGAPVVAPGSGRVVAVPSDPNGFGPAYPVIHWTSGPFAGKTTYAGHILASVKAGQSVRPGQVIGRTSTTRAWGNAHTPGWVELGFWNNGPGGMSAGNAIAPFFHR